MSGKKSWEVASVLDQTKQVQDKIYNSYEGDINRYLKETEELNKDINIMQNNIYNYNFNNMQDIEDEFSDQSKKLKSQLSKIKNKSSSLLVEDTKILSNKLKKIKKHISDLNDKSANLRRKIRNSSDYMNAEYNQAVSIRNNMNKLKNEYQELVSKARLCANNVAKTKYTVNSLNSDIKQLDNNAQSLFKQAKEIKKIRNQANKLKENINNKFEKINTNRAIKFANTEFNKLKELVRKFNNQDDKSVIKSYNQILSEINTLINTYETRYNEWLAKKNHSQELLEKTTSLIEAKELVLLDDFVNEIDNKVSKLKYYDTYKNTDYENQLNSYIKQAKELFDQEDFNDCNEILNKTKKLYEDISNKADNLREQLESSANLALKISDIMLSDDINFRKAHLEIIDDNPINGFKLECQNGDTINFETINIIDGKPTIKIDHIENTGGTCGVRWKDMQKVFNNYDIPLVDVKKDGHSVIYNDVRQTNTSKQNQQRGN